MIEERAYLFVPSLEGKPLVKANQDLKRNMVIAVIAGVVIVIFFYVLKRKKG